MVGKTPLRATAYVQEPRELVRVHRIATPAPVVRPRRLAATFPGPVRPSVDDSTLAPTPPLAEDSATVPEPLYTSLTDLLATSFTGLLTDPINDTPLPEPFIDPLHPQATEEDWETLMQELMEGDTLATSTLATSSLPVSVAAPIMIGPFRGAERPGYTFYAVGVPDM